MRTAAPLTPHSESVSPDWCCLNKWDVAHQVFTRSASWCRHHGPELEQTSLSWPSWYSPDTSHQGLVTAHFQAQVSLDEGKSKRFPYRVSQDLFTPAELIKNEDSLRRSGSAFYCWMRLSSPLVKPFGSCSQLQKALCVFSTMPSRDAQRSNRYLVAYSGQNK